MRPSFRSGTFVLVLAGLGTTPVAAQRAPNRAELNLLVDAWAANLVQANEISGTVLVARGNDILYHKAFGPGITTVTPFPVASLTKPLTVIAALKLVEAGRLSLTDTVGKWLPGFPRGGQLTLDMLLRHRSGIPHRVTRPDDENTRRTAEDMVRLVSMVTPLFPPDSTRLYSSAGYAVVARILELAGGASYARLIDSLVFTPAGTSRSGDATAEIPRDSPGSLVFTRTGIAAAPAKDFSFLVGGGSVYSTPHDLFRIMRRLVAGGYGEASRQRLAAQNGDLSWNGVTNGYRAFADYESATDIMVIFTGNRFTGATDLIRRDVPRLARGERVTPPRVEAPKSYALSTELQQRYAGNYQINSPVALTFESPTFAMVGSYPVYPTSDTTFYSPQDYLTVRVERNAAGAVTGLIWGDNRFPRIAEQ